MRVRCVLRLPAALIAAITLGLACAQGPSLPASDPLAAGESSPLFWRVASQTGTTLYLLGSIHVGPADGWRYPDTIERAWQSADALIVEIDTRSIGPDEQEALVLRYGLLDADDSLRDHLSPETFALLERHLVPSGLSLEIALRMQPWMVANVLLLDAAERRGLAPDRGVESDFLARSGDRSVIPLESAEFQMALMAGLSDELQEYALLDALGHEEDIGDYLLGMVDAWRNGDEERLTLFVFEGLEDDPDQRPFFDKLVFERNARMADRLAAMLEAGGSPPRTGFVVVGAGHLLGEHSIRARLAEHGYTIELVSAGTARRIRGKQIPTNDAEGSALAIDR